MHALNRFLSTSLIFKITLPMFAPLGWADGRGSVSSYQDFSDSAMVCMSVGLTASLTDLDDFSLLPTSTDGAAGSIYTGHDDFHLESNGEVAVLVEGSYLQHGDQNNRVTANYTIDGSSDLFTTTDTVHSSQHQLQASVRLGAISAQKAGDYSGTVTLTVTPASGGLTGCGSSTASYPQASVWGTLAFEDLYPSPGDADYNDFVVNFRITENYDANNALETIHMDFVPVARGAGYNHSLKLSLDGVLDKPRNVTTETTPVFSGNAEVKVTKINLNNDQHHVHYYGANDDITVFNSTRSATGSGFFNVYPWQEDQSPNWMTSIDISLDSNTQNISGLINGEFNYRPYLHVNNTNKNIDLNFINPNDGMIDVNGYPFAIMVPDDWAWPAERVNIDSVYPHFSEYRQWLIGETEQLSEMAQHWYQYPAAGSDAYLHHVDLTDVIQ